MIMSGSTSRPVVAPRKHRRVIKDSKLVVHMVRGLVDANVDAFLREPIYVRAHVIELVVICDDSHRNTAMMTIRDGLRYPVVADGKNADLDHIDGRAKVMLDGVAAVIAGAEIDPRVKVLTLSVQQRLICSFEPVDDGWCGFVGQPRAGDIKDFATQQITFSLARAI